MISTKIMTMLLLLITASVGQIKTTTASNSAQSLPAGIRSYLTRNYSGWRLTSVAPNCSPEYNQAIVTGDFDGNRKRDYAVKIIRSRKGYFVAFLERGIGYEAHVLFSTSASQIRTFGMTMAKRGERYSIGDIGDNRYGRLPNDAPVLGACESEACPYIYRNGRFSCD